MSTYWSLFIIIITIATLIGSALLLLACLKNRTGVKDGDDMGHEYDGIRELNNPLPKWWSYLFWATLVFSAIYLILYPGLGNFKGLLGWTSSNQLVRSVEESKISIEQAQQQQALDQFARELDLADENFGQVLAQFTYKEGTSELKPIIEIANDPEALKVGQRLYLQNCAQCHASDAKGMLGFPNLTDAAWLYSGEPDGIKATLLYGRNGNMPAWGEILGVDGVKEVVSYTLSLSGRKVNTKEAAAGQQRFAVCAACHGTDGKGNTELGAPNLTDTYWLYGGSRAAVTETLMNGRQGVMPAWQDILSEEKIQLLSAYVWSLSNK